MLQINGSSTLKWGYPESTWEEILPSASRPSRSSMWPTYPEWGLNGVKEEALIMLFLIRCTEEQRAPPCCLVKAIERALGAQVVPPPYRGTARYPATTSLRAHQAHHPSECYPARWNPTMSKAHVLYARMYASLTSRFCLVRPLVGAFFWVTKGIVIPNWNSSTMCERFIRKGTEEEDSAALDTDLSS